MIGGVNFQPGYGNGSTPQAGNNAPSNGVQEAIKVLSLRLPRVVGARAVAPQALLEAPGSGGNARVDSVVNQVLARMFAAEGMGGSPADTASFGQAPHYEPGQMDSFSLQQGSSQPFTNQEQWGQNYNTYNYQQDKDTKDSPFRAKPNIIVELPSVTSPGDFTVGPDGRPFTGAGVFDSLPPTFSGVDFQQQPAAIDHLPPSWDFSGWAQPPDRYDQPLF